jgi:hypothetical protein
VGGAGAEGTADRVWTEEQSPASQFVRTDQSWEAGAVAAVTCPGGCCWGVMCSVQQGWRCEVTMMRLGHGCAGSACSLVIPWQKHDQLP